MDVTYINPFISAVSQVFKTMADVEVQILTPTVKQDGLSGVDVSGVIGFSGGATGACVLCFSRDVACRLASAFAGEDLTLDHPDFTDAIGELANMVAGGAKSQFGDVRVDISLPSVIIGEKHDVTVTGVPSDVPRLILPCQTKVGLFHLEVVMIDSKRAGQQETRATHTAGVTS